MKPPISILDPRFQYTPAIRTDIRKTFERWRRIQSQQPAKLQKVKG